VSKEAVTWALQQQVADPGAKLVLVALAHLACQRHRCWPGRAHLAAVSEQSIEKVGQDLRALREAGLVADTGDRAGPSARAVVWVLGVEGPVEPGPCSPDWKPPF